jgi:hypothetical protein
MLTPYKGRRVMNSSVFFEDEMWRRGQLHKAKLPKRQFFSKFNETSFNEVKNGKVSIRKISPVYPEIRTSPERKK